MDHKCKIIIFIIIFITIIALVIYEQKVGFKKLYMSFEHNAFDDQYKGCETEMMTKAKEFLAEERMQDSEFNEVWEKAETRWTTLTSNIKGKRIQKPFEIAVIAYTANSSFYKSFNNKVRTCCSSTEDYKKNFHYKAVHFYLTRAIQNLGEGCTPVSRGISLRFYPDKTKEMRFGQFASSSKNINEAKKFAMGSGTLYNISTCLGASIEHLSYFESQQEVLIPPYEVFNVSDFKSSFTGLNNVSLKSITTCSNFNCAFQGEKKRNNCPSNSAPGDILAWPEHLTHWLLFGLFILFF
ncbi:ecto-ADP-ribosyltransferase 5-like [Macrotis lagotis]|uniref:ecto-ADP-ribosyltransferase 5-like n=1 Tax=Macrotis lagotis TaxID=92651 RepID=UPI003D693FD9